MTTATETWFWIGCAGMALGAIAIFALGSLLRAEDRHHAMVALLHHARGRVRLPRAGHGPRDGRGGRPQRQAPALRQLAPDHAAAPAALWFLYPVAWALGPIGARAWGEATDAAIFTVLDLAAKAVFGVLLVMRVPALERAVAASPGEEVVDAAAAEPRLERREPAAATRR